MYELVPPESKLIEHKVQGVVFKLKVFDFDEHDEYNNVLFRHSKMKDGKFEKDENGDYIIDNASYYLDIFKLGCPEIVGVQGEYKPSWQIIKSVVNKIIAINSVTDLEK